MSGQLPFKVFETDVNQVAPYSQGGGWVRGSPANAADGATIDVVFDLGDDWADYPILQLSILSTAATSLSGIQVVSKTDDQPGIGTATRRLKEVSTPTSGSVLASSFYTVTTASGPAQGTFRSMGRFLNVRMINTAAGGAQGASSKVVLAIYPV